MISEGFSNPNYSVILQGEYQFVGLGSKGRIHHVPHLQHSYWSAVSGEGVPDAVSVTHQRSAKAEGQNCWWWSWQRELQVQQGHWVSPVPLGRLHVPLQLLPEEEIAICHLWPWEFTFGVSCFLLLSGSLCLFRMALRQGDWKEQFVTKENQQCSP